MNKLSYLQGTPWHFEQRKNTCKDGSKYCIYNHNICSNKACRFFHKKCVGKGKCDWFEPKTGTPKLYSQKTYKILDDTKKEETDMKNIKSTDKHQKFISTAEKRVNDIILKIETLENLSNKSSYEYTESEVEKMFSTIEEALISVKKSFQNKNKTRFKF